MKRLLLVALAVIAVKAYSQDAQVFQYRYLPGHTYKASNHIELKATATLSGDQQVIDQLKSNGITQPMILDLKMDVNGKLATEKLSTDSSINILASYTITALNLSINGKQGPLPPTTRIGEELKLFGRISADNQIIPDSTGDAKNDTSKAKINQAILNPALQYIKFPKKSIRVGDTVMEAMNIAAPISNIDSAIVYVPIIYKLVSVSKHNGNFDISGTVNIKLSINGLVIEVNGHGVGTMTYGVTENSPVSKDMKYDLKLKVTTGGVVANGTATMTTAYKASVN